MRKALLTGLVLAVAGSTGIANAAILKIVGPIDTAVALSAANEYILEGGVFIKDGGTLTIPAGTIVRGQPRTGPVISGSSVGTPGFLTVTRTGSIVVAGSPGVAGAPGTVIFTTAALDTNGNLAADPCVSGLPTCDPAFFQPVLGACVDAVPAGGDGVCENDLGAQLFLDSTPKTAPLAPINGLGRANVGLWGGFVVLGRAPTNLDAQRGAPCVGAEGGTGIGQGIVEGLSVPGYLPADACYGGYLPHDSSGSIRYLSVRHAGDALDVAAANELNGVTLAGVGDATVYEFVEVYMNFDDGHEIFGGTVRGANLVADMVGDDNFDTDQGYTGTLQFLFGLMPWYNDSNGVWGQSSGDKATELDGDDCAEPGCVAYLVGQNDLQGAPNAAVPLQMNHQILYNLTVIGSTPDSGEAGTATRDGAVAPLASANAGVTARNGWQGEIQNTIVVNTGTAAGFRIDGGGGNPAGTQTVSDCIATDTDANGTGDVCVTVCSTFNDGLAPVVPATTMLTNGDLRNSTALDINVVNAVGFPNLIEEDHTFARAGVAGKLTPALVVVNPVLNPRPAAGLTGVAGCVAPTIRGITSTAYRGAFNPSAAVPLWTNTWTVRSIAGLIAP